jgi:hypothetical protein
MNGAPDKNWKWVPACLKGDRSVVPVPLRLSANRLRFVFTQSIKK